MVRDGKPNAVELTLVERPVLPWDLPGQRSGTAAAGSGARVVSRHESGPQDDRLLSRGVFSIQLDRARSAERPSNIRCPPSPQRRYNECYRVQPARVARSSTRRPSIPPFLEGPIPSQERHLESRNVMAHPKGSRARVLLSSVFGPFAQDDEFGSRTINPMELYQNQVTRAQGPFSLRMFHRSWGIMLIQHNIPAPSTVLDFPTREAFVRELQEGRYDIVGLSGIIVNVGKIREMCRLVREHSPESTIVVGGHVAAIPGLGHMIDADEIVKGEGVRWFREYLGVDPEAPIVHPTLRSSFGMRVMGMRSARRRRQPGGHDHPLGGLPDRLQLLHDLVVLRREGQERHLPTSAGRMSTARCARPRPRWACSPSS